MFHYSPPTPDVNNSLTLRERVLRDLENWWLWAVAFWAKQGYC